MEDNFSKISDNFSCVTTANNKCSYVTFDGYVIIEGTTYGIVRIEGDSLICAGLRNPERTATLKVSSIRYMEELKKLVEFYTNGKVD